jgi:hypothetical protein
MLKPTPEPVPAPRFNQARECDRYLLIESVDDDVTEFITLIVERARRGEDVQA